jgi:tetratricopeptide (TPR) repeat protein
MKKKMESAKSEVVFINLPDGFESKVAAFHLHGNFKFNSAIPLPVEVSAGASVKPENLTPEAIVAGMLNVLVAPGKFGATISAKATLSYYRNFVLAVRPHILGEFSNAALLKSENGDFKLAHVILDALKALYSDDSDTGEENAQRAAVFLLEAVVFEEEADFYAKRGARADNDSDAGKNELLYQQAEKSYQKSISAGSVEALYEAGFFYKKRKDYGKAKEYFSEYVKFENEFEGEEYKKEKAELNIRVIERRRLDDERFHKAYMLIKAGKEEAGMEELRPFLEHHSDVWNAWFMLGWALRRLGRWSDGAAALQQALDLGGDKSDTHNELAICLMELGELRAAKKELETAIISDSENIKIISNLAILSQKMGDTHAAEAFFRTVLELDPDDIIAKRYLNQ